MIRMIEAKCTCGTNLNTRLMAVRHGNTKSCGCLVRETSKARFTTHGARQTITYRRWCYMLHRCRNPNCKAYKNYGGRGITVCDRWLKFENFLADMGEVPVSTHIKYQIDRIDNNSGYSPENCRWVTPKQNARNMRKTVFLVLNGERKSLQDWADDLGLSDKTIRFRLGSGLSVYETLTMPLKRRRKAA